ncbi:polysaccharide biosynthesis/export family protein [Sphingomonas sp. 35-24ZXX]|uniref:polysaccharide biosynthesis/export family protein n=1 Tax=Sphingomonas sp. 35-24ZXX TaxID=1545915 RepID=UPI0009DEF40F|nr:polysaccharide biosynthesis/export family protein [Sphingomonas sp. 35-24ZXX]
MTFIMLAGCSSNYKAVPYGIQALPAQATTEATQPSLDVYRIGVSDALSLNVFNEPDLSVENVIVDAAGSINIPLVGSVPAAGRSINELSLDIASILNERYLKDARVVVSVRDAVGYTFTIDGRVKKPGTYKIPGRVNLVQAIAIGEGASDNAQLSQIIVLRNVNGQQYAARFNLNEIRAARAANPELIPGDIVVVGFDRTSAIIRDILPLVATLTSVFVVIAQNN